MTTPERQAYLDSILKERGYVFDMHKIMASADFEWLKALTPFTVYSYTGQRILDRKTKELIQTAVETALKADVDQIREHIRLAIEHGASPQEVLEGLGVRGATYGDAGYEARAAGLGGGDGP